MHTKFWSENLTVKYGLEGIGTSGEYSDEPSDSARGKGFVD
jgi:hypothetical protein